MKKMLIAAAVIVVAIGGSLVYLMTHKDAAAPAPQSTSATVSTTNATNSDRPGAYVDYDESLLAATPGSKVIFFHAPWCPQCRQLESEIKAGQLPDNTTIFKVDYDTNQALRQKYGVTLQTTFVKVDDNGNLLQKYVAYDDPTLDAIKQHIL